MVVAAIVWLIARSYAREGDTPRRAKLILAAVRIVVILSIVAMLARPALRFERAGTDTSAVLVLVDDSLSMSLADPSAAGTRLDRVRAALGRDGGALQQLQRDHSIRLMAFSTDTPDSQAYTRLLGAWDPSDSADSAEHIRRSLTDLQSRGFRTDLVTALRDGLNRMAGRNIAAAVLVTDGRHTGRDDKDSRLKGVRELLKLRGVRLITVCAGDPSPRPNLRVASVVLPTWVRAGALAEARVVLEGVNCAGRTAIVRLFRQAADATDWADTGATAEVRLPVAPPDADGVYRARIATTLPLACDAAGEFTYRAVVDPIDSEAMTHDNAARTRVTVSDARFRVLLVSADAGWEFQYLRNYLLREPDRYQVSVWQQNADAAFNQQASTGMRLTSLPRTLSDLADAFDVVLLYDPAHTSGGFDATFIRRLAAFVATHRGGVGYIASREHTGDNLRASGPFDELVAMLPVRVGGQPHRATSRIGRDSPRGWPLRLTGAGARHVVTQLAADDELNRRVWEQLPGIFWSQPVEAIKPGAVALAVAGDPADVTAANTSAPLVATHMYGRGPVVYVGFDSTWRWRHVKEGRYYRRFWANAVDHLASCRQRKRRVVLTAAGDTFTAGEPIRLTAEVYDEDLQPWLADTFALRLVEVAGGDERDWPLIRERPFGDDDGLPIYGRTIKITRPGEYRLTAPGMAAEDVSGQTITVALPTEELDHPEADPALLAELADPGDAIALEDIDTLVRRIGSDRRQVVETTTQDVWSAPGALVLLLALLIAEWIGRKRHNMA